MRNHNYLILHFLFLTYIINLRLKSYSDYHQLGYKIIPNILFLN